MSTWTTKIVKEANLVCWPQNDLEAENKMLAAEVGRRVSDLIEKGNNIISVEIVEKLRHERAVEWRVIFYINERDNE
jgi:hypothetical protein